MKRLIIPKILTDLWSKWLKSIANVQHKDLNYAPVLNKHLVTESDNFFFHFFFTFFSIFAYTVFVIVFKKSGENQELN